MSGFYIPFDFEGDTELNCRICPWKNWDPRRESDYCAHIDRIVDGCVISGTRPKERQARIISDVDEEEALT